MSDNKKLYTPNSIKKYYCTAVSISMPYLMIYGIFFVIACRLSANAFAYIKNISIESSVLIMLLVVSFLFTGNNYLLRCAGLVGVSYILLGAVSGGAWQLFRKYIVRMTFFFNLCILVAGYFIPGVSEMLPYGGYETSRYGGLIGYDFVAFFLLTYLISSVQNNELKFGFRLFLYSVICFFAISNSGRFGYALFVIYTIFIAFRFPIVLTVLIPGLFLALLINSVMFMFTVESYILTVDYILFHEISTFDSLNKNQIDGFYAGSPMTWIDEFITPFQNFSSHLLPSAVEYDVDSGPAYMVSNAGLILAVFYYYVLVKYLKAFGLSYIIILIFLLTDLKFRSAFSLFPMFWLFLNGNSDNLKLVFHSKYKF